MTAPKKDKTKHSNENTIRDPDRAADLARRKAAKARRLRDAEAADEAAAEAAGDPASDTAPGRPQSVVERTKAAALAAAARAIPASAKIRIERIFPSWARGYLETIDAQIIADTGLDDYLREAWGGERFKITVRDNGVDLWTAADQFIGGPPRWFGTLLMPPRPIAYRPDFADGEAPQRAPAPPAAAPAPDPNVGALAGAVADLAGNVAELLRRQPAPANAQGNPGGMDTVMHAIDTAVAVKKKIDALSPPPPPPAPAPERRDDDGRSAIGDKIAGRLAEKGIDLLFGQDKKPNPPPAPVVEAAARADADPDDAEPPIPRAEPVH